MPISSFSLSVCVYIYIYIYIDIHSLCHYPSPYSNSPDSHYIRQFTSPGIIVLIQPCRTSGNAFKVERVPPALTRHFFVCRPHGRLHLMCSSTRLRRSSWIVASLLWDFTLFFSDCWCLLVALTSIMESSSPSSSASAVSPAPPFVVVVVCFSAGGTFCYSSLLPGLSS